ncbi:MAG: DUF3576 domain-containing protein [Magnetococcales bacterium]|nr:DUF3576 domain-containing protein [Magnetococcales bacterium]
MERQGWFAVVAVALLLAGCSGGGFGGKNKLDEHKLAKFGQKKEVEDAKERDSATSAYLAGHDSIFSLGGDDSVLGGGSRKGADAVRADKLFAGAMEVVMALPIQVANREGGIISTDWKVDPENPSVRYRVNIHVTGQEPYGTVRVVVLKQVLVQGSWQDRPADEEAAVNIAKSIRKHAQVARP